VSMSQEKRRQRRQRARDGTKGLSGSMAKAVANLAFVEALVKTGARDETEVNWSRLSLTFSRAQLKWKTLTRGRRDQPPNSNSNNNLGLQEVGDGSWAGSWIVSHAGAI